jgi:serine/threonine-protein phosphatase PPG1
MGFDIDKLIERAFKG